MDHAKKFVELAMRKKLFAWAAGACALMLTSGVYQPADAKQAGHSGASKGSFSMGHSYRLGAPYAKSAYAKPAYAKTTHAFKHKHAFRHHHRRIIVVGYNDYAYGSECYWLRRKALYSGSAYWWNRYYACVEGY